MEDLYSNQEARLRFEAYRYIPDYLQHFRLWQQNHFSEGLALMCSRLQASAVAFGESLAIPEIVAIGGQVRVTLLNDAASYEFHVKTVPSPHDR